MICLSAGESGAAVAARGNGFGGSLMNGRMSACIMYEVSACLPACVPACLSVCGTIGGQALPWPPCEANGDVAMVHAASEPAGVRVGPTADISRITDVRAHLHGRP